MIRRALDALYTLSGVLAGLFLVAIFLMMLLMSVGREFGLNVKSGDDITSWCMAAMAFLGLAHTFKKGEMIRVGLLLEHLPKQARHVMEAFCLTVGLAYVGYFTWHAWRYVSFSYVTNETSTGVLVIPMWIPQLGFLAGLVLLAIALADELVIVLSGRRPTYEKDKPLTPEEIVARAAEGGGV